MLIYHDNGRPANIKTWLALWMEMKGFKTIAFSRRMVCSEVTVANWRRGEPIDQRMAMYMRALYPDAPVSMRGGRVALLHEKLPVNARTMELYRFLVKIAGLTETYIEPGEIYPLALERARAYMGLKPYESPVPSRGPNPKSVANVFPLVEMRELEDGAGI